MQYNDAIVRESTARLDIHCSIDPMSRKVHWLFVYFHLCFVFHAPKTTIIFNKFVWLKSFTFNTKVNSGPIFSFGRIESNCKPNSSTRKSNGWVNRFVGSDGWPTADEIVDRRSDILAKSAGKYSTFGLINEFLNNIEDERKANKNKLTFHAHSIWSWQELRQEACPLLDPIVVLTTSHVHRPSSDCPKHKIDILSSYFNE